MPSTKRGTDAGDICNSCNAEVVFSVDASSGVQTCPACGARQLAGTAIPARPRAGRRVVDIDTPPSSPRKSAPERTKAQSRHVAAVKKELNSHRPVGGALDGSTAVAAPARQAPPPPSAADSSQAAILRARWREMTDGLMSRDGRPHRETDSYDVGAVILHTRHGMGIVASILDDGTLTALFRGGFVELASTPKSE